jgi:hypothetical protein
LKNRLALPQRSFFRVSGLRLEDVVDRLRELALGVRVAGGVHQHTVAEKLGDGIEHVLAFLASRMRPRFMIAKLVASTAESLYKSLR